MTPCATLSGAAYGVALNDREAFASLAETFRQAPHGAPPSAPVLYIKPRNCFSFGGASTPIPDDVKTVRIAATIGVLFARDLAKADAEQVPGAIGAACLALDVAEPDAGYFRPPIRQTCRDSFLPIGGFAAPPARFGDIVTEVDGEVVHSWSPDRLRRPLATLASEISAFMTLRAGDLLLIGLAADAPEAASGSAVAVHGEGLPSLTTALVRSEPR